jgi:serine phosphatase RsbU (regulator of sigma subunit)
MVHVEAVRELWSASSYAPHLLSLPFAFAPAAMLIVLAYALVMRGAPRLRGWLIAHVMCLLPYSITMTLSPSIVTAGAAEAWFRFASAFIPMAAGTGAGFQLALVGRDRRLAWIAVAACGVWTVAGIVTPAEVSSVHWIEPGFWYANAGAWAWLALVTTVAASLPGFLALGRAALFSPPSDARRQLRLALAANVVTYSGLVDVAFAYGHGVFPIGWLMVGTGSLLLVRALISEDLLRVRAIDTTAPVLVAYLVGGIVLAWVVLRQLVDPPWWGTAAALVLCFAGVRVSLAVVALVNRGARGEGPLDRLIGQLVSRARDATDESSVARLGIDVIGLGLGVRLEVLLAAAEDWGFTTVSGERVPDERAPDPLLAPWLALERGALFANELDLRVPEDLREMVASLFAANHARAIVPLASHDELLGLIVIPADVRVPGRSLEFVERAADTIGEAIVHARMAQRAARRAELAREVELAATVQKELLPDRTPRMIGDVAIVGSWFPATRCAGDFWCVHPLDGNRVLVAIGDVTGHGVASAMVTAAAVGACEVTVRRGGVDLSKLMLALDASVRRVGGGQLSMTAAAAIVDTGAGTITFASCGHTVPYLCRPTDAGLELTALVARGNLLGTGVPPAPKVQQKGIAKGDLLVWYTDGIIDAPDPNGDAFGDRRLQRLLRGIARAHVTPTAVHDRVHAAVTAHRAGRARNDDETLVIARVA